MKAIKDLKVGDKVFVTDAYKTIRLDSISEIKNNEIKLENDQHRYNISDGIHIKGLPRRIRYANEEDINKYNYNKEREEIIDTILEEDFNTLNNEELKQILEIINNSYRR